MAGRFSYSNSIVRFRYMFQKTTANSGFLEYFMHFAANSVWAHFQKTSAANPLLGHGTIKLLKPLHITRTGVRPLHNASSFEIGVNGTQGKQQKCVYHRTDSGGIEYYCEKKILCLLKRPLPDHNTEELNSLAVDLSVDLSNKLEHIRTAHSPDVWDYLHKTILTEEHISKMWKIALYNRTDSPTNMLRQPHEPQTWRGKSGNINRSVSERLPWRKGFPLKGEWEMEIHRTDDEHKYTVHFEGKSRWFSSEKKSGSIFITKNPNGVLNPIELAFEFGEKGPWPSTDPFVIRVRPAGPNVLVGQAWKKDEKCKDPWGELVLIKIK